MLNKLLYYRDVILKKPNLDNGFLESKPIKKDWKHSSILGMGIQKKVLFPDFNPSKYRSKGERQRRDNSAETMACTNFSTCADLEEIMNRMKELVENGEADDETKDLVKVFKYFELYDDLGEANLSDRFQAKVSGTSRRGNSFTANCNSLRKNGIVAEKFWATPNKYTWNEFYTVIPQEILAKGREFLEYVEINHEWVYPSRDNDCLKYSPSTTSVFAGGDWNSSKIHQRPQYPHNHAVLRDYFKKREYDGIFDSYIPFDKKVSWNYGLGMGKIFSFRLKKNPVNLAYKFLEENEGKNVKHDESAAIWFIQNGKKKLYPDWLTYISFNGLSEKYIVGDRNIIEQVDDGEAMDIKKSLYWPFLENVQKENQQEELLELLYKK